MCPEVTANPPGPSDIGLERRAQLIAERHAPAFVIIDEQFQVLHFSSRSGRFIEPDTGAASLDLMQLIHRDLRLDLRSALYRAAEENTAVTASGIQVGVNGNQLIVDLTVEPLQDTSGRRNFAVIFKDAESKHRALEGELRATRERLQATIKELETSREELRSVNEELTTVNGESAHRVQELTRATSDLKNFQEATQIATVFLDNDLKVMNFTPAVTQVLHLVETDIGRPIGHIKARIPIEELYDDVRRVLRTLAAAERELAEPETGTRYIVRILPYRSVENYIAGVVITFVDVTAITRAEERQRLLLTELQHRVLNTLGVIRSISRRSAETSTTVEEYAMHLDGRLNAFARTQALVTRDPEAGVDLEYLVAEELFAYRAHEDKKVQISGPAIRLNPNAAETLGLAIHELATNAVKYGALSEPAGRVSVSWQMSRDGDGSKLTFSWQESNGPTPDGAPSRRGFGTELLERTLAYELKAQTKLEFEPRGLICTIEVPLTSRVLMNSQSGR